MYNSLFLCEHLAKYGVRSVVERWQSKSMDKYLAPKPIGERDLSIHSGSVLAVSSVNFWLWWVKVWRLTKRNRLFFCAWLGREGMTCMKQCGLKKGKIRQNGVWYPLSLRPFVV